MIMYIDFLYSWLGCFTQLMRQEFQGDSYVFDHKTFQAEKASLPLKGPCSYCQ